MDTVSRVLLVESNTSGTGQLFPGKVAEQGFRPCLLAREPSRYTYVEKEDLDVIQVDTQNDQALLELCGSLSAHPGIAGVTSSSEYFIGTAAALARNLHLPGPDPGAIDACRDKHNQRLVLERAGVGMPAFRPATSVAQAVHAAYCLGFPVVVKPVSGTGSAGVKLCDRPKQVSEHAATLLQQTRNERGLPVPGRILIEAVAVGPEFSVETFGLSIIGITQKHLGALPYFVETGHDFPAILPAESAQQIHLAVRQALEALQLGWGPAHLELRLTADGPRLIEVNPRLAGGHIPRLVLLACGVDLIAETVRLATGCAPRLQPSAAQHASIRFLLAPHDGTLTGVEGLDAVTRMPGVVETRLYARLGDCVRRQGDFRDRVGHVMTCAASAAAARAAAEVALCTIRLLVDRGPVADEGGA